jgi:molybdopterin-guanine dinucleotide biosynthesis protein A
VLAGGRASRFGGDKLAAIIDGRTLLDLAVASLAEVCDEVVVVLAFAGGTLAAPPAVALPEGVVLMRDPEPGGGPLMGILAAARAARHERLLVVGGDMPSLVPAVLHRLLEELDRGCQAAAIGLGPEGEPQPLPLALHRSAARALDGRLVPASDPGSRSLRAFISSLVTTVIPEVDWRPLDPDAASLRDVDTPRDLPGA